MKRITIKDIAKELGISPSTVSRALNDKPGVKPKLREMIKTKARELDYLAFGHAKALKTKKTMTVGIIVSDIKNPFFLDFLDSVEGVLFPRRYRILLSNSKEDTEREKIYIEWMVEHGVDGLLVAPSFGVNGKNNLEILKNFKNMGIPVVLYDRIYENAPQEFDSVTIDNEGAIKDALSYLKMMGHKRIGIVLADSKIYTIKKRSEGFKEWCENFGLKFCKDRIIDLSFPFGNEEKRNLCRFLKTTDSTAIIATSHTSTRMVYNCLMELGKRVPNDVSLIGFDDVEDNLLYPSPLTVIKQPVIQIGKTAATLLLSRLDGENHPVQRVILKAQLIERESVKKI